MVSLQKESEKDTEKLVQNTSWEKEFEKVMGCIPECANGLYEDVGCPAHGYDAMKAVKFFRGVLSKREKEIAEEVEKINNKANTGEYLQAKEHAKEHETALNTGAYEATNEVLQLLKH